MKSSRLIILLSLLLAIAPVTVAYSALLVDKEPLQTKHCMQSDQQDEQFSKSCCDDDQCGQQCQMLHCGQFSKLSALHGNAASFYQPELANLSPPGVLEEPGGGWPGSLLRPPIHTL